MDFGGASRSSESSAIPIDAEDSRNHSEVVFDTARIPTSSLDAATPVVPVAAAPKSETLYDSLLRYHDEHDGDDSSNERRRRTGERPYRSADNSPSPPRMGFLDERKPAPSVQSLDGAGFEDRKPPAKSPPPSNLKKPPPTSPSPPPSTTAPLKRPPSTASMPAMRSSPQPRSRSSEEIRPIQPSIQPPRGSFYQEALDSSRHTTDYRTLAGGRGRGGGASGRPGIVQVNEPAIRPDSVMYRAAYGGTNNNRNEPPLTALRDDSRGEATRRTNNLIDSDDEGASSAHRRMVATALSPNTGKKRSVGLSQSTHTPRSPFMGARAKATPVQSADTIAPPLMNRSASTGVPTVMDGAAARMEDIGSDEHFRIGGAGTGQQRNKEGRQHRSALSPRRITSVMPAPTYPTTAGRVSDKPPPKHGSIDSSRPKQDRQGRGGRDHSSTPFGMPTDPPFNPKAAIYTQPKHGPIPHDGGNRNMPEYNRMGGNRSSASPPAQAPYTGTGINTNSRPTPGARQGYDPRSGASARSASTPELPPTDETKPSNNTNLRPAPGPLRGYDPRSSASARSASTPELPPTDETKPSNNTNPRPAPGPRRGYDPRSSANARSASTPELPPSELPPIVQRASSAQTASMSSDVDEELRLALEISMQETGAPRLTNERSLGPEDLYPNSRSSPASGIASGPGRNVPHPSSGVSHQTSFGRDAMAHAEQHQNSSVADIMLALKLSEEESGVPNRRTSTLDELLAFEVSQPSDQSMTDFVAAGITTTAATSNPSSNEQARILAKIREEQEQKELELALKASQQESGSAHDRKPPTSDDFMMSQEEAMKEFARPNYEVVGTGRTKPTRENSVSSMDSEGRKRELLERGTSETQLAIKSGQAHIVVCRGCGGRLQAPVSYSLVFCPRCQTISPS